MPARSIPRKDAHARVVVQGYPVALGQAEDAQREGRLVMDVHVRHGGRSPPACTELMLIGSTGPMGHLLDLSAHSSLCASGLSSLLEGGLAESFEAQPGACSRTGL